MWAPEWDNRWLPYFKAELSNKYDLIYTDSTNRVELIRLSQGKDLFISMWAQGTINFWADSFPGVPIISYVRRYELFEPSLLNGLAWNKLSALIFVNDYLRDMFVRSVPNQPKRIYTIYNAIDLDNFSQVKGATGDHTKIAVVCKASYIKNLPLAILILTMLPENYTMHHLGSTALRGQAELMLYADGLGVGKRLIWNTHIPSEKVNDWLVDKDFILSTSINEGNPNNVLEGMAMGLKPIVHAWPGADTQFPEDAIFKTAEQAAQLIMNGDYQPLKYRQWIKDHYSLDNIKMIHKVIEDVMK